ncbi:uncharacterized protein LOC133837353 [Drosophila sulfurigaster albostrigata]|uniref:uncharacterized protein LOC132785978 n=1 Tax=Drosophila nasuta TaxID=42062 RepID=UPI00295E7058|nr:uncharacterized protein LOC132785978 [Drosophila nasuta]XP_062124068.1 uncharacterized protein LOC133837353 [Drosophila sulfurigaster albostrigata]
MFEFRFLMFGVFFGLVIAQIAYVEDQDIDKSKSNLEGRKPLYSPARCSRYQLLYPGDQQNDWICDCAPAALYYPETDACYPAYRQGPCKVGEILVLYKEKVIPECVNNPCQQDGHFMIRDKCYEFGNSNHSSNPCPFKEYTFVLGVNPKTLMVDCVQLSMQLETRLGVGDEEAAEAPPYYHIEVAEKCLPGSRLYSQGVCNAAAAAPSKQV